MTARLRVDRRNFLETGSERIGRCNPPRTATRARRRAALSRQDRAQPSLRGCELSVPRKFSGDQLRMISFPMGGVAAGSLGLGGRGQLVNWEIFNRPNKGLPPVLRIPVHLGASGNAKPVARVLESRILPPYEGQDGLGSDNAPGLSRLQSATFTGEYPLAHIDFDDSTLPVKVELDAFSPFIPHEPDDSGLPVAILRYRVTNPGPSTAHVSIAFSIDNPVKTAKDHGGAADKKPDDGRRNEYLAEDRLAGLVMSNPNLAADDPMAGEFVLAATPHEGTEVSHWQGWPLGRWWNSPLHFWDRFSDRRPGRAAGAAQHRGHAVPEAVDSAGQVRLVSIPARLAVSKSHARLVRMERPARRGQFDHRQLLLCPFQKRVGRRSLHSCAPRRS